MPKKIICCFCQNNTCLYKKEFQSYHKKLCPNTACSAKDRQDYQNLVSGSWFPTKAKLVYHSTCPMLSYTWWKNSVNKKELERCKAKQIPNKKTSNLKKFLY